MNQENLSIGDGLILIQWLTRERCLQPVMVAIRALECAMSGPLSSTYQEFGSKIDSAATADAFRPQKPSDVVRFITRVVHASPPKKKRCKYIESRSAFWRPACALWWSSSRLEGSMDHGRIRLGVRERKRKRESRLDHDGRYSWGEYMYIFGNFIV